MPKRRYEDHIHFGLQTASWALRRGNEGQPELACIQWKAAAKALWDALMISDPELAEFEESLPPAVAPGEGYLRRPTDTTETISGHADV